MNANESRGAARKRPSDVVAFVALASIAALTRLPFLSLSSFGLDPDAWRVALAAEHLASTGEYVASRFPGYPVHEIGSALVWSGTAFSLNAVTVLLSGVAAGFFGLVLRHLDVRAYGVGAVAFALTPVVFLNSVVTMDYMWSLAFVLGALYFVLTDKSVIASIFLGLAIGARLTAAVMWLPLTWLLYRCPPSGARVDGARMDGWGEVLRFTVIAVGVAGLCYAPVLATYGLSFLRFYDGALPLRIVLHHATLEVWGLVGFFAVVAAVGWVAVRGRTLSDRLRTVEQALLAGIGLYVIVFLRLPLEAGYLIPVVPLVLAWLALRLPQRGFVALCLALIASPFVLDLEATSALPPSLRDPSLTIRIGGSEARLLPRGPMLTERVRMTSASGELAALAEVVHGLPRPAVVLAGPKWTRLAGTLGTRRHGFVLADSLGALWGHRTGDPLSRLWPPRDSVRGLDVYVLPGAPPPAEDDARLSGRVTQIAY
jgi:hypothetical protein